MRGVLGKKLGMTHIYDDAGHMVPVTVVEVGPNTVLATRTVARDGYSAVQLGYGKRKPSRVSKALRTHVAKAGYDTTAPAIVRELRLTADPSQAVGDKIGAETFKPATDGEIVWVDVIGVSKGRGFMGVVRRHHFAGGRASHGGGWVRKPGSIGCRSEPGKIHKNKRMAGHMGHERVTVQNLRVVQVRTEPEHLLFVRGAVPGPTGGYVMVRQAVKHRGTAK